MHKDGSEKCPHAAHCPLYPQFQFDAMLRMWKATYCEADYARCERFRRSNAGQPVPVNLLPNGRLLAAGGR